MPGIKASRQQRHTSMSGPLIATTAAAAFVLTTTYLTVGARSLRRTWLVPAAAAAAFLVFSLYAVATEGLTGVWQEHVRSAWGNQIWIDLLLAVTIGWYLILPRARSAGMNPAVWLPLILLTGCIGFLAMLSRLTYLEQRT